MENTTAQTTEGALYSDVLDGTLTHRLAVLTAGLRWDATEHERLKAFYTVAVMKYEAGLR